ncbi:phosphoglucosamine mutase [Pannus brasiliensis CCIBt3594]|uniref:Phosphoglucosamine mutase n=1 Tax=Pannus brasiliensis CCIBt3594 TaxID=1427578 RepID=A0AAW9QRK5_9CHRO
MVSSPPYRENGYRDRSNPVSLQSPREFFGALDLPRSPLFGTDGIRGKAGELLTAPLALQLGFWAGQVFGRNARETGPVIIGQDSRNSSDMLANAIAAGLTSAGLEVWQLGLCPTPCVAKLTRESEAIGGIMISASHNPPEDNGIKFFDGRGLKVAGEVAGQIEAGVRGNLPVDPREMTWGKCYSRPELVDEYARSVIGSVERDGKAIDLAGMKIVLDLAWGASVNVAPSIFQAAGAEVICLHDRADGDRINVHCGSTHLETLQAAIIEHGADLGFAFDGDADRVMAVDGRGRVVDGDYILYLWGRSLREEGRLPGGLLVATVMANLGFERAWEKLGGQLQRTAVGDQHVQARMWETGAMLGGEQSGHILCHHYGVSGDGTQTALHLAALVRRAGVSLETLVENSFTPYPQILRNARVEDREVRRHWQECEPLRAEIERGEQALAERGRILVRASGTEPLIRVMVEADSIELADFWTERLIGAVKTHLR